MKPDQTKQHRNWRDVDLVNTEILQPLFIEGSRGRLFCMWGRGAVERHASDSLVNDDRHDAVIFTESHQHLVLFLPAFGEEVNLCRRFYSLVRAQLTSAGCKTVQADPFGSGDSEGELSEASWRIWQEDLRKLLLHVLAECTSAAEQPKIHLSILAVRAGSLMAHEFIDLLADYEGQLTLRNLVFVQPEYSGEEIVNRLFRARVLAKRLAGDKSQDVQSLWSIIERGESVLAGGHLLSAGLCRSLREQDIGCMLNTSSAMHRSWFERDTKGVANGAESLKPAAWQITRLDYAPFWQSYDTEPDPTLIDSVVAAVIR